MTESSMQKYAFFQGQFVPLEQAKIGIMTHAFNYGTGVFEGIRAYWNDEDQEMHILLLREHFTRLLRNCRMMCIGVRYSLDELCEMAEKLVSMHTYKEDIYIRPLAYKSSEQVGVSMEGVADDFAMYVSPFGAYVDIHRGLSVCVSSWRRTDDNAIPSRAKVTGNYVNSALSKNEAVLNGYDEAIVLDNNGYVAEVSAANIFIVRDGTLITPHNAAPILEGYTRDAIMELAKNEMGIDSSERAVGRSELYYADEVFICGTGVQLAAVTSIDKRPIGNGEVGPISAKLQELYFDAVKGRLPRYRHWLTTVKEAPVEQLRTPVGVA